MKKKIIHIIFIAIFLVIPGFSEPNNSYFADYEIGNNYFDRKEYNKAIKKYLDFWKSYTSNIDEFEKSVATQKDHNGIIKESYFSLYNTACCYSLLEKYEDAEYYLMYALFAGYPYIDHILKDSDLSNLFTAKKELKKEIQNVYNKGNSRDIFLGKRIYVDSFEGICYCFFKDSQGNYKFTEYGNCHLDAAKYEIYGEGEFEFKNFKLSLKYNTLKEIYQNYDNNFRTEKIINHDTENIYWYTIGTDRSVSTYFIKDDWNGSYKNNNELLIPINK